MSAATLPPKVPESLKKGLPRYDQGGTTPPAPPLANRVSGALYPENGHWWVWTGSKWEDLGPAQQGNLAATTAARQRADAILAQAGVKPGDTPAPGAPASVQGPAYTGPTPQRMVAQQLSSPQAVADYIRQQAKAYAARMGAPGFADAFAQTAVAIAWGESSLGQANRGDGGLSHGIYQLYFGPGSADAQGRKRGLTPQQADDPAQNIDASLPDLWNGFVKAGQQYNFGANPQDFLIAMWRNAQHPSEQALATHGRSVAPQALAIGAGKAAIPGAGNSIATISGGSAQSAASTPAGQAGYRTNVDPGLLKVYTDNFNELTRLTQRQAALNARQAQGIPLTSAEQNEVMMLPEQINAVRGVVTALQPMVKPAATESAAQQALAASQTAQNYASAAAATAGIGTAAQNAAANAQNAASTYAGTMAGIVKGMGDLIHTGFADDAVAAEYMRNVVNDAFNQAKGRYDAALQKGQLDLNGYAAVVTATATAQAAEAAYALQALKNANYISDENWKRAQMLLPAGTHYQPGFAPNSPMNQALKQLGLGQMVIETTPLPEGWNDPEANLTKGTWANERMGYANPAQAFTGPIAGLQGTVDANKAMPALSFAPPAGFNLQPLTPRNYDDVMAQYKDVVAQFTGGAYIPMVPTLPTAPTGDLPGGPDSTDDTTGVPPTAAPTPPSVRTDLNPSGQSRLPTVPANIPASFNPATNQLTPWSSGPNSFQSGNPQAVPGTASGVTPRSFLDPGTRTAYTPGSGAPVVATADDYVIDPETGVIIYNRGAGKKP